MGAGASTVSEDEAKKAAEEKGIAWDTAAWEKLPRNESGGVDVAAAVAAQDAAEEAATWGGKFADDDADDTDEAEEETGEGPMHGGTGSLKKQGTERYIKAALDAEMLSSADLTDLPLPDDSPTSARKLIPPPMLRRIITVDLDHVEPLIPPLLATPGSVPPQTTATQGIRTRDTAQYELGQKYSTSDGVVRVTGTVVNICADNGSAPPEHSGPGTLTIQKERQRAAAVGNGFGTTTVAGSGNESCNTVFKFSSSAGTMHMGEPVEAARGIWAAVGIAEGSEVCLSIQRDGVAEITREFTTGEHCDDKDRARFFYISEQAAKLIVQENGSKRDIGNEGKTLDDFCLMPEAVQAGLTRAHVLALRLYTSNSYFRINGPLREGVKPHPYAATAYFVHSAIAKLRTTRANDTSGLRTFWRGMQDMAVSQEFMNRGGTELGCMSTTQDRALAETKFAKVGEQPNPLLLKVEAASLMNCGADIQWLSMYPEEKEVLFPPLTYLLPVGKPVVEGECTVITVQPTFS
jgi:hypothetical protein